MRERDQAAMNAAGWHVCLDVLEAVAERRGPVARVVGQDAAGHGWEALRDNYADALGV